MRLTRRKVASVMAPTISSAAVKQALVQAGGSVTGAARTLGIASASLRRLVRAQPLLADVVFEQIEREIDAAHQVLWDGLDSDSAMTPHAKCVVHPAPYRCWAASRLGNA